MQLKQLIWLSKNHKEGIWDENEFSFNKLDLMRKKIDIVIVGHVDLERAL